MISDATGETLISVGRAVAAQYKMQQAIEHVYPLIRTSQQLKDVLKKIDHQPGIVLHTFMDDQLSSQIERTCQRLAIPAISVLEPVFHIFRSYLGQETMRQVSAQHVLDEAYFRRIEALDYTIDHDDGLMPESLAEADVILVGISRVSKTPTSIYLANRGVKVANIPLIIGIEPPVELIHTKETLIVGLVASVERITMVRQNRILGDDDHAGFYKNRSTIIEELHYAQSLCARHHWPVIDVTHRSIEETAAAILTLMDDKKYG